VRERIIFFVENLRKLFFGNMAQQKLSRKLFCGNMAQQKLSRKLFFGHAIWFLSQQLNMAKTSETY
jgi:hypothetical protein